MADEQIQIEVEIDPSRLDLDDFLMLADFRAGKNPNPMDQIVFLDHIVKGGIRGRHYPADAISALFAAVERAMDQIANPVDATGKA